MEQLEKLLLMYDTAWFVEMIENQLNGIHSFWLQSSKFGTVLLYIDIPPSGFKVVEIQCNENVGLHKFRLESCLSRGM